MAGDTGQYDFIVATQSSHFDQARHLFREYSEWLNLDLSFQNFSQELDQIDSQYNFPSGGLILIRCSGEFIGCAGIRRLDIKTAELKRMYIRQEHRGFGLGTGLMEKIIAIAKERKYKAIRLDTFRTMGTALHLYKTFGFYEIDAYRFNPGSDALYLEKIVE